MEVGGIPHRAIPYSGRRHRGKDARLRGRMHRKTDLVYDTNLFCLDTRPAASSFRPGRPVPAFFDGRYNMWASGSARPEPLPRGASRSVLRFLRRGLGLLGVRPQGGERGDRPVPVRYLPHPMEVLSGAARSGRRHRLARAGRQVCLPLPCSILPVTSGGKTPWQRSTRSRGLFPAAPEAEAGPVLVFKTVHRRRPSRATFSTLQPLCPWSPCQGPDR